MGKWKRNVYKILIHTRNIIQNSIYNMVAIMAKLSPSNTMKLMKIITFLFSGTARSCINFLLKFTICNVV